MSIGFQEHFSGHVDPLPALRKNLAPLWGSDATRTIRWTLHCLAGRVH